MSGLVPQDAHAPLRRSAFDFEHVRALEPLEARMRKIEGNRHTRHAVGREPFVRQPEMGLEVDEPAPFELLLKRGHAIREHTPFDADAQLAHAEIEELFVRPVLPLLWRQYCRL